MFILRLPLRWKHVNTVGRAMWWYWIMDQFLYLQKYFQNHTFNNFGMSRLTIQSRNIYFRSELCDKFVGCLRIKWNLFGIRFCNCLMVILKLCFKFYFWQAIVSWSHFFKNLQHYINRHSLWYELYPFLHIQKKVPYMGRHCGAVLYPSYLEIKFWGYCRW